jgi:DNA invertase Pin-like site-specific DNA recombinase
MSGAGKTMLLTFLLTQSVLQGAKLVICDPHAGESYIDDDLSGKREDRPRFQQLLANAKADRGSLIIVHKFDRLARDTEALLRIIYKELLLHSVRVESVMERIDPYTPLGKMMLTVSGGVSTYYIDNLASEVRKGLYEKWQQGGWVGPLPLGYQAAYERTPAGERIKGTGRAVFSADISTARLIFELYATGNYSDLSLAEEMNRRGLTALHKGRRVPFGKDTIGGILTNPFYIGMVRYKGEEHTGAHDAAIDRAIWDRVQVIHADRARRNGGRRTFRAPDGLLLEIAYCGRCGARLHWNKGDKDRGYYWCSRRRQFGKEACDMLLIDSTRIEPLVLDVLRRLTIPATLRDAVLAFAQQRLAELAGPQETTIAALTAQLERLKDMYELGDIPKAEYLRKRERLQRQLAQATPPSHSLDIERATALLSDLPTLLANASREHQRVLIRQVLTTIWIEKAAVTAIKPAANFLLLVEAIATEIDTRGFNGDLDWDRLPAVNRHAA